MRTILAWLTAIVLLLPDPGSAADIVAGKAVFARCAICHNIKAGEGNKVGPNLHGIFGRKAGSYDEFAYSEAMKKSGIVWGDASLSKFLQDPRSALPGNRMAFPGIKNKKDMADLLAYLHQAAE